MSQLRMLPELGDGDPYAHYTSLAVIRDFLERATDSSPFSLIDHGLYMTTVQWCEQGDKRAVVQQVLASRLKIPGPSADKAIILSQALPVTHLAPLLDGLKGQTNNANPLLAAITFQLHAAGQAEKEGQDAETKHTSEKYKWDLWTGLYGKSKVDWRGLPKQEDMGWGWWVAQDVGADEWWCVAKKDEGEGKEGGK